MQKLFLATIALALVAAPLAAADSYSGSIAIGHPVTAVLGGVTENAEPCTPDGLTAGVDGMWFDIGAAGGLDFTLTMDATLDADVWFYTAECGFINDSAGAQMFLGETEAGTVPEGAAYAVVDGYAGTGSFELTIG